MAYVRRLSYYKSCFWDKILPNASNRPSIGSFNSTLHGGKKSSANYHDVSVNLLFQLAPYGVDSFGSIGLFDPFGLLLHTANVT